MDLSLENLNTTEENWNGLLQQYETLISNERNEFLRVKATIRLGKLAKYAPKGVLLSSIHVLVMLLNAPVVPVNPMSIQEAAAYCLNCFISLPNMKLCIEIGQSGAIPSILSLLPLSEGRLQKRLIKCLRSLVVSDASSRKILERNGGLKHILNFLSSSNDDIRRYLLEILSTLVTLRKVRRDTVGVDALRWLIVSVSEGKIELRSQSACAIGLLGQSFSNRRMLFQLGAIPALIGLFKDGDARSRIIAGNSLGIIMSHIDCIHPAVQAECIPLYVELLEGSSRLGRKIAVEALCISGIKVENAVSIGEQMARILQTSNNDAKLKALVILRILASYKHSISFLQKSGVIRVMIELLQDRNENIRKGTFSTLARFSYKESHRKVLADEGAISILMGLVQHDIGEMISEDNVVEILMNFSKDQQFLGLQSEIFSDDIIEYMQIRFDQIREAQERWNLTLKVISMAHIPWYREFFS